METTKLVHISGILQDARTEEFIADAISRGAKTIISQNKTEGLKKNILYINSKDPNWKLVETGTTETD